MEPEIVSDVFESMDPCTTSRARTKPLEALLASDGSLSCSRDAPESVRLMEHAAI
jgi:hypothetical protein